MSQVMRRSIAHRYATRNSQLNSSQSIGSPGEPPIIILSQSQSPSQSQTNETPAVEVVSAPNLYKQLQDLEEQDGVIRNNEFIFCVVCNTFIDLYDGIYVRNCLHQVCIDCIRKTIIEYAGVEVKCPNDGCEYYLQDREIRSLLTQPEYEIHTKKYAEGTSNEDLYKELLELEEQALIRTTETFECQICFTEIQPFEGIMIRECLDQFCIDCVRGTITSCEEAEIKCPAIGCNSYIHDREVRSLLTQSEFDKYNAKILRIAESKATNSYHCKLANCEGWCIVEEAVNEFICPRCSSQNCLGCQAIHLGKNCKQYQEELKFAGMTDNQLSEYHLDEIVRKNKGMRCTTCKIVIMKRTGCDWLVCSMCKTELCWATKMSRWGPNGRGDTSGGCGCTLNKRCHPKCRNCH